MNLLNNSPLVPLGFWRGIYGFMCKTVWNLALLRCLKPYKSRALSKSRVELTQLQGKVKVYWNSHELELNSVYTKNVYLSVPWLHYPYHGGNPSCRAVMKINLAKIEMLKGWWQQCRWVCGFRDYWYEGSRLMTMRCECLNSHCMDNRSSSEFIPAKEPGQITH